MIQLESELESNFGVFFKNEKWFEKENKIQLITKWKKEERVWERFIL